jgi:CubicO group peptidase (beta-lactamase class C family)
MIVMGSILNANELRSRLNELISEHDVPGAALGVLRDGEVIEVAAGVINKNTGVEATPDTVFEIGSMGKAWTTTVLMQLVDEGKADVDATVRTYIPDFKVADPEVSEVVTLRHLLAHTSGIDGDHFEDFGRGDDVLERYVASCASLHQTHPLGATMSYCNTGYSILGRIIELLTGKVWDDVMRERLYAPLGLEHSATFLQDVMKYRISVGHVAPAPGEPLEVSASFLPRSCGPMGLIISTVGDVLSFARLHLEDGRTPDGKQLVSGESIRAMQSPQIEIPDRFTLGSHWGLGMILFDWDGHFLYGHDGGTIGQSSVLRIFPEGNMAITLLACGGDSESVYRTLFSEILTEVAGVAVPPIPEAPETPVELDLTRYAGAYERLSNRYDLRPEDGKLVGTITLSGPLVEYVPDPVTKIEMTPVDETTFLVYAEGEPEPAPGVFYAFEDGVPQYLHSGARANPRVGA